MKRRLPIGIQDFATIREEKYCYVDKTARIHQLITSGKPFFLSRPRRFGKSLLCSTLGAVFEGKRELFSGLAIDSLDWEWKKHPVIRIDLNAGDYDKGIEALYSVLASEIKKEAEKIGIEIEQADPISQFKYLLRKACNICGEKAAVIIDEYDKPLLSTMDNSDLHLAVRNTLKGFYGVLKSYDEYLKFVFLTGVSKFSHVSIFSDLNQLIDITFDARYADICGITQEEMEENFAPEIDNVLESTGRNRKNYLNELRRFYNGYRFSEKVLTVYNPFGLLNHFDKDGKFSPYWYETGTPTFLPDLIKKHKINVLNLDKLYIGADSFRKSSIDNMETIPLLYQTGYLTITDYDADRSRFTLGYPNEEVTASFAQTLVRNYLQVPSERTRSLSVMLSDALYEGELNEVMEALKSFFASIPYDIIKETENYFQTAVHLIFTMLGFNCRSEVRIAGGRIDTLVETKNFVYCFEFKLNKTAEEAMEQIDGKDYLLPWKNSGKKLIKAAVIFDHKKRNISEWKIVDG